MIRRLVVWGAVLAAFVLLAFWLQGAVQDVCIVPAIGLLRMGGLLLRSIPQSVFWSLLVAAAALIVLGSLANAGRLHLWRPTKEKRVAIRGPIEKLAQQLHHTRRGLYFKWLVAHRLSELALAIVTSDEGPTSPEEALRDLCQRSAVQAESAAIQAYLQAGLGRPPLSQPRLRLLSRQLTTLDLDPTRVIEYLAAESMRHSQSQMETKP